MKNPLSYTTKALFTGKEINSWCYAQLNKAPSFAAREARRLLRKNYKDDRIYENDWTCRDTGAGAPLMVVFKRYKMEGEKENA